ncbi:MAG: hypothetical protein KZQ89_04865 [Candidatus Thiodiazotropha sp. (ex Lucinoma kastoroae)]|nr:hypothetical protein [Candidatus Thiodiazotropha sp. (ex Lucinoma kastoroae)]MCU7860433.1 hypothetical protein [Candidatus Thiodiazotropha sp. (ex Lucinoma kastoroae)]
MQYKEFEQWKGLNSLSAMSLSNRLRVALVISVGLHLLMIWVSAYYSQTHSQTLPSASLSPPIQITLVYPKTIQSKTRPPTLVNKGEEQEKSPHQSHIQDKQTNTNTIPDDKTETEETRKAKVHTVTNSVRRVSSAQIMTTATIVTHEIAVRPQILARQYPQNLTRL